jgi:chromosome segregation ATPase
MRSTKKLGKQVKKKHKSKRLGQKKLGKGPEDEVPFLLKEMLDATSLSSHNRNFYQQGLVSQILQDVPRAYVTEALESAPYKKEVAHLLSQKFKQSANSLSQKFKQSANSLSQKFKQSANSRASVSKIINTVPTRYITIGRKKQPLMKELKIAQDALDAYIVASQPIHDRKEELFNKLGDLEDERDELEKVIGQSKLDKYDDLKKKYDELNTSQSMLKRSSASLIKIRLATMRFGPIGKLYALIDKIEKLDQIYTKANEDTITAYEEEDRLKLIVHNLKTQIEDLEDL